jgi:membrane protein implicated in regulation of membrane protease activity
MKSFVRKIGEDERWFAAVVGVLVSVLWLAAEATNELAYLLLYAAMAIQYGRKWLRQIARRRSKELPGAARNTGSR